MNRPSRRKRAGKRPFHIEIVGAGKVGTCLYRALRDAHASVRLRKARGPLPRRALKADLLILAVRDAALGPLALELARGGLVDRRTPVVHCSGALSAETLSPLRGVAAGVAQMHPMISFASPRVVPTLARGQVHIAGDPVAVRAARRLARLLGMSPRTVPGLDPIAYHAAAGLVANGAAALAAAGASLLETAGVAPRVAPKMLGPLLRSVADNVERLGLPHALTGPVRRGDAQGVLRHLEVIRSRRPELEGLYRALVLAQVPLARELLDAPASSFEAIETAARSGEAPGSRAGKD
jgi:predicted short-subunit dehydrogenase-like oxidoreductase (DUF2520 family)